LRRFNRIAEIWRGCGNTSSIMVGNVPSIMPRIAAPRTIL